jgi:type IV secretory pathway TrbL component
VAELIKLALLIAVMIFLLPICLLATFWCLSTLASGNIFPFLLCLIIALYFIGKH